MPKSAVLDHPNPSATNQSNRDRIAAFLEANKPKRFSRTELSLALSIPVSDIAIALKDHANIKIHRSNRYRYFWDDGNARAFTDSVHSNPRCPHCDGLSVKKGVNPYGKYRYVCKVCKKGFNGEIANEPTPIAIPDEPIHEEIQDVKAEEISDAQKKLLDLCRRKTFAAVRNFRNGVISRAIAKKIAVKAFASVADLPISLDLSKSSGLLRLKVVRACIAVTKAQTNTQRLTEAIAHLISYMAFPYGKD